MTNSQQLVQKLWNYCNILCDDGLSYGDYVEQPTYLLFLKMSEGQSQMCGQPSVVPAEYSWPACWPKMAMNWKRIIATRWKNWAMGRSARPHFLSELLAFGGF